MKVELDGSKPRVENLPQVRIEILPGERFFPQVGILNLAYVFVNQFFVFGQDLALFHQHVQHPPVLRIVPGDELYVISGLTGNLIFTHPVEIDMDHILLAERVPVSFDELAEVTADRFASALGKPGIERHCSFGRAAGRDHYAVQIEFKVLNQAAQVALDATHFFSVMTQIFENLGRALLEVDIAGSVGLDPSADNLFLIARGAVNKGREAADVVGQRFRLGNLIQTLVLLEDVTGQHHIHLAELRPGVDGLDVVVDEIAVGRHNHGIQPHALVNDGHADVPQVHLVSSCRTTGIEALGYRVGVMLDGIAAGHAELGCIAGGNLHVQNPIECFIGNLCGIGLERVQVRDIALDEQLQHVQVDKAGGVRDDGGQELLVLLVTAKLRLAVFGPGNYNLVQF